MNALRVFSSGRAASMALFVLTGLPSLALAQTQPTPSIATVTTPAPMAGAAPAAQPAAACRCVEDPLERRGGRGGVGLTLGYGQGIGGPRAGGGFNLGASARFGGAFTDRVHVLGEFTLGGILGGPATAFYGALDLQLQGFIGPNFYIRGGIGIAEAVTTQGGGWNYSLPGPRLVGAVGYDIHRLGERSFALELNTSYAFLNSNGASPYDSLFLISLGAHVDFY